VPIVLPSFVSLETPWIFASPKSIIWTIPSLADHDVVRFDVTVYDSLFMGRGKAVRNLNPEFDGLFHRERTFEYYFP